MNAHFILASMALSLCFPTGAFAQQQSSKTYQSGVEYDPGNNSKNKTTDQPKPSLAGVAEAKAQATAEMDALKKCTPQTPCDQAEIDARKANAQFVLNYQDDVQNLGAAFTKVFNEQVRKLRLYSQGTVDDANNATVSIMVPNPYGELVPKDVSVKDLFRFIAKYEVDAANAHSQQEIEDLKTKYEKEDNLESDAFFHYTLPRAKLALLALNDSFRTSVDQSKTFEFNTVDGKDAFQVVTIFRASMDGNKNIVSSELLPKDQPAELRFSQTVSNSFNAPTADRFWKAVADNRITMNGVLIDGQQRRIALDKKYSTEPCGQTPEMSFPNNPKPGLDVPYSQVKREACPHWMRIISATMYRHSFPGYTQGAQTNYEVIDPSNFNAYGTFSMGWQPGWPARITRITPIVNVTDHMQTLFEKSNGGTRGKASTAEFTELNQYIPAGTWAGDVILDVRYKCGCNEFHMITHFKTDMQITLPACN